MISAFVSGASGPGLSLGWGHCVVFLGRHFPLTVVCIVNWYLRIKQGPYAYMYMTATARKTHIYFGFSHLFINSLSCVFVGIKTCPCWIQPFRQSLPHKNVKASRQCRLVLWVVSVRLCLIEVQGDLATRRKNEYTCLCCFLPPRWNTMRFTQATVKPPLPIITFDIVA